MTDFKVNGLVIREAEYGDNDKLLTILTEKYGAIIVATGYNPIELNKFDEYAYSQSPDVVSSLEFERLCNASGPTNGHLRRPSDGKEPKNIVFVQCVGSRCSADSTKGHEYCSKICCMYTAKHAILTRDHYPDTNITVFYIHVLAFAQGLRAVEL